MSTTLIYLPVVLTTNHNRGSLTKEKKYYRHLNMMDLFVVAITLYYQQDLYNVVKEAQLVSQ